MAFVLRFFTCLVLTLSMERRDDDSPCCVGVTKLKDMVRPTLDRQQACKCLKAAAQGIDPSIASSFPGKCGSHSVSHLHEH
ncbi:unnamed protein product [Eruca vesicaria subsp. sativa]|uniref:Bifunctional inhibitor/plant lipid transfer protein/seed storage helical domain-containing protein n=1 Tax=Eruca vesicaria subsp. sativa TaxID=29727 RepID=A0ABC8IZC2_ERUVS|nr:unnamed protein product [Eruca vesicaria subsp. sativa]